MVDVQQLAPLFEAGNAALVAAYALEAQRTQLCGQHIPRFWGALPDSDPDIGDANLEDALAGGLKELCSAMDVQSRQLEEVMQRLLAGLPEQPAAGLPPSVVSLQQQYRQAVSAHLLATAPVSLAGLLHTYLDSKLAAYADRSPVKLELQDGEEEELTEVPQQHATMRQVMGDAWLVQLESIAASTQVLGLGHMVEEAATAVACSHVQQRISSLASQGFHTSVLHNAQQYVEAVPLQFLQVVSDSIATQDGLHSTGPSAQLQLQYNVFETVARLRIGQLFDIVVDYPDSLPAVRDIRDCLSHSRMQQHLVSSFRAAIRKRLLHAGAATTDIIVQYVSTIKTLREVDPSGVLLEAVADPIRHYLRSRKDTVRCVVTMLTNDSEGDAVAGDSLFEELNRTDNDPEDVSDAEMDDDEGALAEAQRWEPDLVNADPMRSSRTRRMNDIIAALVGIYGSKELFINEYRLMLADKLASKSDFDSQRELRTMELLKLRFGEANLHNAEIMLGDIATSKRINLNIHEKHPRLTSLKGTIVSELFWPPFQGDPLKLPAQISGMLEAFAAEYHNLKAPRKLQWKPYLGSVQLKITAGGVEREMRVAPLHAAIIVHFSERPQWPVTALAVQLELTEPALHKALVFWTSQGVLREVQLEDGTAGVERIEDMASAPTTAADNEEERPNAVLSAEEQQAKEMGFFEQYILGMLANFDGVPIERIHNMLKMFLTEPRAYDKTIDELAAILSQLVSQEKLDVSGGLYCKA